MGSWASLAAGGCAVLPCRHVPLAPAHAAYVRALGSWALAFTLWSLLRTIALIRWDDFGLPTSLLAVLFPLGALALVGAVLLRGEAGRDEARARGRARIGRALWTLATAVAATIELHLEDTSAPGRFLLFAFVRVAMIGALWGTPMNHALDPSEHEAPAKSPATTTVHLAAAAGLLVDLLKLARELLYEGWP